ncbi:hypothetical protein ACH436_13410 [Isoptericola sp. NPDC019693]|uniref:hypothetical protein n=1 Tax=Isoptericola sp. NPDC019693 TaxID=3364009 RepID=UPI0037A1A0A2
MRAGRAAVVVALAAAGLVGCTTAGDDAEPLPSGVAQGLTAELRQDRTQYADHRAKLHVVNGSDETVTLLGGALDAPGYGPSSPDGPVRARTLAPGAGRDVRLRLGEVDCDAAPPAALAGADAQTTPVATATVLLAAGAAPSSTTGADGGDGGTAVEVQVTDPLARLAAVHREACAERLVASGVTLRVTDVRGAQVPAPGGDAPGGRITLAVDPVAGGPDVRLVEISGTTLLSPAAGHAWTGDDLAGQADGQVVLDVVPARCDPHVVAEDKRGTFLPVHAEVDGARQPEVYVPMTDQQRAAVYDLVHDACGWG